MFGVIRYVKEAGNPKKEQTNKHTLALVFAMKPLAKVVAMNFLRYLCRYLLPKVRTPRIKLTRPIAIP